MAETTLILEPEEYSHDALFIYAQHGVLLKNGEDCWERHRITITTLVVRLGTDLSSSFLCRFPSLRWIVSSTTGLTHVDLHYCASRGIRVVSLKGEQLFLEAITSTSELTIALMLALLRYIPAAHKSVVSEAVWDRNRFKSRQCSNMTLGMVGFGRIGKQMHRVITALRMRCLVHDPYVSDEVFQKHGATPVALDELLSRSDVVSIHVDDRRDNFGMVNRCFLQSMKRGALLINTSRGELVDETAVVEALTDGTLSGLAVDVLVSELSSELLQTSPILAAARAGANVIVTPHVGGCSRDAMELTETHVAEKWLKECLIK